MEAEYVRDKYDRAYDRGYEHGLTGMHPVMPVDDRAVNYADGYRDGAFKRQQETIGEGDDD